MRLDIIRPRNKEDKERLVKRALQQAGYDGKDENEVD